MKYISPNCLATRNAPRYYRPRGFIGDNAVRAYREGPESVQVQLRMQTGYACASLSFEEALEFAKLINAAVKESTS